MVCHLRNRQLPHCSQDDVKELQHLHGDLHLTKEMLLGKKVIFARAANKLLESAKTPGLKPN